MFQPANFQQSYILMGEDGIPFLKLLYISIVKVWKIFVCVFQILPGLDFMFGGKDTCQVIDTKP